MAIKIGSLTGLQIAINSVINRDSLQEGEFTVSCFVSEMKANGKTIGRNSARRHLDKLVEEGALTSRQGVIGGAPHARIYKAAQ
jgi:Fe2+ or Zn2+ uptake regulation protein